MKILVVEDEALIAMEVEEMIAALGAEIVGSFSRVTDALEAIRTRGDTLAGAALDVQLDGATTLSLVDVLLGAIARFSCDRRRAGINSGKLSAIATFEQAVQPSGFCALGEAHFWSPLTMYRKRPSG